MLVQRAICGETEVSAPCYQSLSFVCSILAHSERLCMNRVRSSLRMRCMLLGYSFNPRLNGRVLGTVGSVTTIGLIKKMDAKNQFDERKKN